MQAIGPNEELLAWYEKNPMKKRRVKKKGKKSGMLLLNMNSSIYNSIILQSKDIDWLFGHTVSQKNCILGN